MRMRLARIVVAAVWLMLASPRLSGDEPLRMQLFPAVAREPAVLTIRVTVEPAEDNRTLQVTAESATFYRSSEAPVDGRHAAPLNVFQFRNLPTGTYQVTCVLIGANGQRATAARLARVMPAPGGSR
jgi:hypothetical protein